MYNEEIKEQIIKLYFEQRRTLKSLSEEFGIADSTIKHWVAAYRERAETQDQVRKALETMEENQRLKKKLEELEKENDFLKKAAAFFAKESKQ